MERFCWSKINAIKVVPRMKKLSVTILLLLLITNIFLFSACNMENTIVVYTEAGFAPFEYIQAGKVVGVDVDIMNLVGEKLGKKVVFECVGFDMIIPTVSAGKLCNVGAAGISITEERLSKVDFSNPYYKASLYVIFPTKLLSHYQSVTTDNTNGVYWDTLAGKNVAIQGGTTADIFLRDELEFGVLANSGTKRTAYDKYSTAVADVGLNVDCIIMDKLPAEQLIAGNDELSLLPLYYKGDVDTPAFDEYAICVTKGHEELLLAINQVLDELGEDGINALISRHLGL